MLTTLFLALVVLMTAVGALQARMVLLGHLERHPEERCPLCDAHNYHRPRCFLHPTNDF